MKDPLLEIKSFNLLLSLKVLQL